MAKSIKVSGNVGGKRVLALLLLLQSYSWETTRISFVYPDNSHNKYKYCSAIVGGLIYYGNFRFMAGLPVTDPKKYLVCRVFSGN